MYKTIPWSPTNLTFNFLTKVCIDPSVNWHNMANYTDKALTFLDLDYENIDTFFFDVCTLLKLHLTFMLRLFTVLSVFMFNQDMF